MYSRQEAAALRNKFWEVAGQYFAPIPSESAEKVNWINYKTGVRFISFRLQADEEGASAAIELSHPDPNRRKEVYTQFFALRESLGDDWRWEVETAKGISRISRSISGVNIYNADTWPAMISFLKKAIIRLDAFWVEYKEIFE